MEYVYKLTGCYNQCHFRRFLTTDVEHSNRCAMAAIDTIQYYVFAKIVAALIGFL